MANAGKRGKKSGTKSGKKKEKDWTKHGKRVNKGGKRGNVFKPTFFVTN